VIDTTVLCDRCIRAVRSRGEKIYVGDLLSNERFSICMWCDAPDDELFKVVFEAPFFADIDFSPENEVRRCGKCRW
jgi:hypothetical protein